MFIRAVDGLGHRIIDAQISYQLTDMYGSILVAGAMGYGANVLFLIIEKQFVHWSEADEFRSLAEIPTVKGSSVKSL